jgi:hypothetical protein
VVARILLVGLMLASATLLGGCFGDPDDVGSDGASASGMPAVAGCDHPLLGERVRAREIDVASDPTDRDHLAVGLIVSVPNTRGQPPHDWPFWDALARSEDGGKTWTFATLPGWAGDTAEGTAPWVPSVFLTDPIVTFLHDGTLVLSILAVQASAVSMYMLRYPPGAMEPESASLVVRSAMTTTGGAHTLPIGPPFTVYNDKQQVFEDPATGDLFVTWFWRTDLIGDQRAQPMLSKSVDGGRSWSAPVPLYEDGHYDDLDGGFHVGSWPFVTLDGTLHAIWWDDHSKALYQVDSPDRGETFGAPRAIADAPTSFDQPGGVIQLGIPSIEIDRSGGPFHGSVYVTWEDRRHDDRDVFVMRSRDDARTWSAAVRVNDDAVANGRDQFMPQLTVQGDGGVAVLFMDMREDPENGRYVAMLGLSQDVGETFANVLLSSEPSPVDVIANGDDQPDPAGRTRLGDYVGVAPTKGGVVAVWQDSREGTTDLPYSNAYLCTVATA